MKRAFFLFAFLFFSARAQAATYYIAASGGSDSNSGADLQHAWATFVHAWTVMKAGDTLMLGNGEYDQQIAPTFSCSSASPCKMAAINDGQVVINGASLGNVGPTVSFYLGTNYWEVDGIIAENGNNDCNNDGTNPPCATVSYVWRIYQANNITLRRVSGYNANPNSNSVVIGIVQGNNNLIEDCIAGGMGRKMIYIWGADGTQSKGNIIRRCFAAWQQWNGTNFNPGVWPWGDDIEIYDSSNNIYENNIAYGMTPGPDAGVTAFAEADYTTVHNALLGNMSIKQGLKWDGTPMSWPCPDPYNSAVACATMTGGGSTNRSGLRLGNYAVGDIVNNNLWKDDFSWGNAGCGFDLEVPPGQLNEIVNTTVLNNALGGSCYSGMQPGSKVDFDIWTNNYVDGIDTSGTGARLIYQYQSTFDSNTNPVPTLTTTPLWPWPMESRIQNELGTYLAPWLLINPAIQNFSVTSTMMGIFSSLPAAINPLGPSSSDTLPPAAPRGLGLQ